jgi:serine/threonine protein phosphatase PrpC
VYRYIQIPLTGKNHERKDLDSDDRVTVLDLDKAVAIAVADGAGSACSGRLGAEIAVHAVRLSLREIDLPKSSHTPRFIRRLFRRARDRIVRMADLSEHPLHDYATTLIVAVLTPRMITTGRIGDGCVVVATPEGEIELLSHSSRTGPANVTEFLTDEGWHERLAINRLKKRNLSVAAFTDGIEYQVTCGSPRKPHLQFFEPVFRSMHSRGVRRTANMVQRVLQNQIAERSGDDMTIVVATPEAAR